MIEFELEDIEIQGDIISAKLPQGAAKEIKYYANSLGKGYELRILVVTHPVRQQGVSINSVRAEAGMVEYPHVIHPPFEITVTVRPAQ